MKKAVYPGSFDPITLGHLDVIIRASKLCEELTVLIADNHSKVSTFSVEERISMIKKVTSHIPNIKIDATNDLVVRYASNHQIHVIVRGLRNFQDYENEYNLSQFNKNLHQQIETIMLFPSSQNQFVSSSAIKELVYHKADISRYVPEVLVHQIVTRLSQ